MEAFLAAAFIRTPRSMQIPEGTFSLKTGQSYPFPTPFSHCTEMEKTR